MNNKVIQAVGAESPTIFDELCAEVSDGHVTVSLSRDVVSLSCANREHAMRVFSLLEKIAELRSRSFSDYLDKRYS